MKLKYYLRGLGIGIIITTIILMIAHSGYTKELTDEEIIARAEKLGMLMKEESLFPNSKQEKDSEAVTDTIEKNESSEILEEEESETEGLQEDDTEQDTLGEVYRLVIPPGTVPRSICRELEENGVIESAEALREYLVEVGYTKVIRVGAYDIPCGATNEEVYEIFKNGPILKK